MEVGDTQPHPERRRFKWRGSTSLTTGSYFWATLPWVVRVENLIWIGLPDGGVGQRSARQSIFLAEVFFNPMHLQSYTLGIQKPEKPK